MTIVKTYEILSQTTGDFVGAFEIIEGEHVGELWDEEGDFHTYLMIDGLHGDDLYKTVLDEFAANKGCSLDSVYLTDDGQNEILMAL